MRETIWLYLRNSVVGRFVRSHQHFARPLHALGCRLLPGKCRIRSGPCAGLFLQPSPSWPTDLWEGGYEAPVQAAVEALLKPGAVLYDVGGGEGLYCLLGARKGAQVFAFEPHPVNAERIAFHARLNSLESLIHVLPLAAHSSSGLLALEFAQHGSQMAPAGHGEPHGRQGRKADCITLDEFSRSHPAPTLVKVDVEGAESEVLRGAEEMFERVQPSLICEVHDAENERFVRQWLADRRYSVHWLEQQPGQQCHLLGKPGSTRAG